VKVHGAPNSNRRRPGNRAERFSGNDANTFIIVTTNWVTQPVHDLLI